MKLAREIAYEVASYEAGLGKNASSYELEPIIAARLMPVIDELEKIRTITVCEVIEDEGCSPKIALVEIKRTVYTALAMLEGAYE